MNKTLNDKINTYFECRLLHERKCHIDFMTKKVTYFCDKPKCIKRTEFTLKVI